MELTGPADGGRTCLPMILTALARYQGKPKLVLGVAAFAETRVSRTLASLASA